MKTRKFEEVKESIDDMSHDLEEQKKQEEAKKDFCVTELNTNTLETEKGEMLKEKLTSKEEDLSTTIEFLTASITTLNSEITELQKQLKKAGEDREAQNKEFQATVADQRATAKILQKALSVLEGFYGKQAAAFAQQEQPAGPPPPPGFKPYKKSGTSGGVMGMMQQIIDDAKAMEAEALKGEEDAMKGYEVFVKESNDSIEFKNKHTVDMMEERSKDETAKVEAEKELASTNAELDELAASLAQYHKDCDFVMKNFEISQAGKDEEVEALKQAIAIFSGSNFAVFLSK
jgi:chromosome segregation ATPase